MVGYSTYRTLQLLKELFLSLSDFLHGEQYLALTGDRWHCYQLCKTYLNILKTTSYIDGCAKMPSWHWYRYNYQTTFVYSLFFMFIMIHLFVRDSEILFYISLKTLVYNSLQAHPLETLTMTWKQLYINLSKRWNFDTEYDKKYTQC